MVTSDLAALVDPAHTAMVTSECQVGVVGEQAIFPELAAVARGHMLTHVRQLVPAARRVGVDVIHAVALRRPDGRGSNRNARLFGAAAKAGVVLEPGSAEAAVLPDLFDAEHDLVSGRLHGIGPMAGTDLDALLRNLGVTTVVVVGVSVNVAVTNLVMDAVNLGYQVVLPRDAVAGVPPEYAESVIDHTLSLLATITTTSDLLRAWNVMVA
jgi:nicotinamidase-related amidase